MLPAVAAHGGHRPQLHHIQHRRDGAHIVLAQQQPQQPLEMLRLPVGLAQHVIQLLQGGHQNLPQLIEDLRLPAVAGSIQGLGQLLQALLHAHRFQKVVQRLHLPGQADAGAEGLAQLLQWLYPPPAGGVQGFQPGSGIGVPLRPQTVRVVFPFSSPPDAPDVPEEGIVFQQIAGVRVHAGQGRAQIAEDTALVIVAEGGIQCGEDGGNHALLQNILGAGLVDRDVHPGKNQAHQGLILPHVRADQGDIPVAAALGNQGTHPVGCLHHLCPGRVRPADPQELGSAALLNRALEQLLPEDAQRVLPLGDLLHLHRNMQPLGSPVQLRGSLPRLLKGQLVGADAVAVQAHRNLRAELNQMLQNGHMLPGEIREAVNVKYVLPGEIPILQLLQQPGHLVPGVPLAPAAQAVVALHQQ